MPMKYEYRDNLPDEAFFEFIVTHTEIPAYCHSSFEGLMPRTLYKRIGYIEVRNEAAIDHMVTIKHNGKHFIPVVIRLDDSRIGFAYQSEGVANPLVRFCSVYKNDYRAFFEGFVKIFKIDRIDITYNRTDQDVEVTIYK